MTEAAGVKNDGYGGLMAPEGVTAKEEEKEVIFRVGGVRMSMSRTMGKVEQRGRKRKTLC